MATESEELPWRAMIYIGDAKNPAYCSKPMGYGAEGVVRAYEDGAAIQKAIPRGCLVLSRPTAEKVQAFSYLPR